MTYTWLITGCGRGFGCATATAVLRSGSRLVATAEPVSRSTDADGGALSRWFGMEAGVRE